MQTPDVLVIGAGVIGLSLARELAREGRSVTVLDSGPVGGGASSAAAGLLSPTIATSPTGPLIELCYRSAALYEPWIGELRQEGAGDVGYLRAGLLETWTDEAEAEQARAGLACHVRPGRRAEWLPRSELLAREPALAGAVQGAILFPDDAQVNAARLTGQLARVAERSGVLVREHERVLRLEQAGDRISLVRTSAARYRPGIVVLAAGLRTGELMGGAAVTLPFRPVKGQLLMADCRISPVRTPLHCGEALFVPQPDGPLMLGVTVEEDVADAQVTLEGLRTIVERTMALVPAVGELSILRAWAGVRPATPDGWPYMGRLPGIRNLWISAGHYRKGILLAPLCANLLAASISADQPVQELTPFSPARVME